MKCFLHSALIMLALPGGLSACATGEHTARAEISPVYSGIETSQLATDLVNIIVHMDAANSDVEVADYATCAMAEFAQRHGYGYARHLRTNVTNEAGVWQGDAVYSVSSTRPRGMQTIDTRVAVATCVETGIPTV